MWLRACILLAFAGVLAVAAPSSAQKKAVDPDVAEGVRLVETGDYDAAILTLDNASRRLAADPSRVSDLSRAYLYLGIAYLGKGHEAAARAKFREAVTRVKDLTLSPEEFSPRVIDLFEAARAEAAKAPAPTSAATAALTPAPKAGGGSGGGSKTLLVVGGIGGAGALAAIALGGKGGGGGSSTTPTPTPTPGPVTTDDISGFLPATEGSRHFPVHVLSAGTVVAQLSWAAPAGQPVELVMQLFDPAGRDLATSNRTGPTTTALRADVIPQEYSLSVFYSGDCPGCEAQFHLLVTHP